IGTRQSSQQHTDLAQESFTPKISLTSRNTAQHVSSIHSEHSTETVLGAACWLIPLEYQPQWSGVRLAFALRFCTTTRWQTKQHRHPRLFRNQFLALRRPPFGVLFLQFF